MKHRAVDPNVVHGFRASSAATYPLSLVSRSNHKLWEGYDAVVRQDLHHHRRGIGARHRPGHGPHIRRPGRHRGHPRPQGGGRQGRRPRYRRETSGPCLRRHRQGRLPQGGRPGDGRVRPRRRADQQCRHHPAAEDHGHRARQLRRRARRQPARHAVYEPGGRSRTCASASRARSSACRRCRPSAAAAFSAGRITAPPRAACSASPRPWRASSAPTTSASTR